MKTSIIRKALVLLMVLVCQQVHAHDFEVNGIYYGISLFNKNTAYVTHKGKDYAQSYAYSDSINIPDKVTYNGKTYTVATIGGYAFWNCADLKSVTLPNTITDIHQHAFEGCHGLETIAIPASVNKIHDQAFFNCHKLNLIELKHTTPPTLGNGVFEGVNYNQARLKVPFSAYNTYKNNSTWNSFKLAHYDVNGIYYQPVSNSQVKVSYRNIYDENSGTFYNSYSGNVTIPSEVTIDGNKCTVTSIGEKAFSESGGLKSVVIPSSVHTIEEQAFYDCFSMTSVTIGNGVTTINSSAFHGCTGLTSVTIPNSVTNIGDYAFTGCSSIKTLSLGSKVSNISNYAFYGCKGLISVTSLNPTPPTCGSNVFKDVNVANIVLTVPAESISLYKAKTPWSNFKFEEQTEPEEPSVPEQPENPSEPELPEDTSGLSYNIINSTDVEVIAGAEKYSGDIVIPSQTTIDGKVYNVTKVGNKAFYECTGLTSVTIPNSVTSIGNYAFYYCSGLTSITIPNSVTNIGEFAFYYCSGLTSITIPNSVTNIGEFAFFDCSGLTSITIPNSVTNIGEFAFSGCSGLTSITIPEGVTSIGEAAFSGCRGLTSIIVESGNTVYDSRDNCNAIIETSTNTLITGCKNTVIPNSVTSIGNYAFYYCSGLTSITIPEGVTSIGEAAFRCCSGLTSISIPNSVTSIGDDAFDNCNGLTSVTIPNSVTSIGDCAFLGCGLTSITIPNSVTSIGSYAFQYCSNLISVRSLNPTPPTCGTAVFNNVSVGNITLEVPAESVSMYQSADTWKDFGTIKGIVEDEPELPVDTSVLSYNIISETEVEVIAGAEKYTGDIVIPSQITIDGKVYNVTKIGDNAFYACNRLTSVTIPNSVTGIGYGAFYYCSKLTSITIPNSVTSIGNYAFEGCSGLISVNISDLEAWCKIDFSTYGSNPLYYAKNLYLNGELLTNIEIPNSITEIKQYAFYDCSGLKSVTIPEGVTSIGESAFYNCGGLTSVTIPNSVTSIGEWAFYNCGGLTSVTIPNSVRSIGRSAFSGCSGMTSVNILDLEAWCKIDFVNYVSNPLFNAENLYLNGELLTNLEIPNSITEIKDYAFFYCSGLTSVTIPESVTRIGNSAFSGCSGMTSVAIGNSVTSIGDYAFSGCKGLTCVTIPERVTSIGDYAFSGCSNLISVRSLNPTPPTCEPDVFYNVSVGDITLEVPAESVSLYQSADTWKDFGTIKGIVEDEPELPTDNSGLSYKIINSTDVEVIAGAEKYTGDIVIPSQTTIDGKTYKVTKIGDRAFYECSGLTSITIPNSVTSIGKNAFVRCTGLTSISIPNSVTSIGENAFYECYGLTSVIIGNSVTSIGYGAFNSCSGLTSITIPNSVSSIEAYAFCGCDGLTSITIPNSVTSIGNYAFGSCSGLSSIIVETGNSIYDSRDNCNAIIETSTNTLITGCKNTVIPNSVTSIGYGAFNSCRGLTSVTIPNSVTSIGNYVFGHCHGLTSITIPNSVTSIGDGAFYDCDGLTSITIPNSVTSIGKDTFKSCDGLTSITIGNSVTTIGYCAFKGCAGLTSVTIPNSVTSIGEAAFENCFRLTSITIGNSVTEIGNNAFSGCDGLTSITSLNHTPPTCETNVFGSVNVGNITLEVPAESVSLYQSADTWKDFGTIKGIELPEDTSGLSYNIINSTDVEVIAGAEKYTGDIVIPSQTTIDGKVYNVTKVGNKAFYECTSLTSVTIPNSVTSIGNYAFYYCSGLTSITIPEGVISIGSYAFYYCSKLTSITIPEGVTSIGDFAFAFCIKLTSITIPNSVTSIGKNAFSGCSGLTSVISLNPTPPTCGTDVFGNVSVGNITLEVPAESVSLYQSADTWKDFGTITAVSSASRSESSGIDDILAADDEVEYYNLHGVRIVNPTKGIYIKREGNKVTKVVL